MCSVSAKTGGNNVFGFSVDNFPESHKPVKIGDLRLLTIRRGGRYLESNPTQKGR